MPKLRLGTYLLPPGEVVLIRTLVRLFSQDNEFGWVFANEGPYDALIMDHSLFTANEPGSGQRARAVLKLTPGNEAPSAHTLQRPIKAEKLQAWLKNTASELSCGDLVADVPSNTAPQQLLAIKHKQTRFKLLRWPPTALLQNDARLIRMSSLLSRRALHLSELAELSHQSVDSCFLFIEQLFPMKLIVCEAVAVPMGAAPRTVLQPSAPARLPFHRGLINSIRKRLGI